MQVQMPNSWIMIKRSIAYEYVKVYLFELESNFASIPMIIGVIPASSTILAHHNKTIFQIKSVFVISIIATLIEGFFIL
ncbi:hypothetical protein HM131_08580 [Halobacillus mangrovi]|uniref:Uncharacterized protein n=1 Tax=Halobacillus mangrovi TaxID=402384 RepID=A0A1W5ZUD9_9BACI|nr:hypothetical protein HM131_08580 [Halobacillus mangrovi]